MVKKVNDKSMEVKLPAFVGNHDRPSNRPTNHPTDGQTGSYGSFKESSLGSSEEKLILPF